MSRIDAHGASDLGRAIDSPVDAERAASALRLFPKVLLHYDERVQAAFVEWKARHGDALLDSIELWFALTSQVRQGWPARPAAITVAGTGVAGIVALLQEDMRQFKALTAALGLSSFRSWLPQGFQWEFSRATLDGELEVTLPLEDRGEFAGPVKRRAPKQGSIHREDMQRNLWLYWRAHVKAPRDSIKALEREYIRSRGLEGIHITNGERQVKHAIARAKQFLDSIQ